MYGKNPAGKKKGGVKINNAAKVREAGAAQHSKACPTSGGAPKPGLQWPYGKCPPKNTNVVGQG